MDDLRIEVASWMPPDKVVMVGQNIVVLDLATGKIMSFEKPEVLEVEKHG